MVTAWTLKFPLDKNPFSVVIAGTPTTTTCVKDWGSIGGGVVGQPPHSCGGRVIRQAASSLAPSSLLGGNMFPGRPRKRGLSLLSPHLFEDPLQTEPFSPLLPPPRPSSLDYDNGHYPSPFKHFFTAPTSCFRTPFIYIFPSMPFYPCGPPSRHFLSFRIIS